MTWNRIQKLREEYYTVEKWIADYTRVRDAADTAAFHGMGLSAAVSGLNAYNPDEVRGADKAVKFYCKVRDDTQVKIRRYKKKLADISGQLGELDASPMSETGV
ncbi:MAG: hypothetical protein MPK62_00895 [Alphaproteobacteria bacterium]|nr:hypothetical protein [Alphaproteobacteria bacterium]MDA8029691.1 hypothetical protein [Alphaproteobacteria bacterium]